MQISCYVLASLAENLMEVYFSLSTIKYCLSGNQVTIFLDVF